MKIQNRNHGRTISVLFGGLALAAIIALGQACASSVPTSASDRGAVKNAFEAYVQAGDQRDLSALENLMHPRFRVVAQFKGSPKISFMSRADYLGLMKAGKLGGSARAISLHEVETRGDVGSVRATLNSGALRFHARYSFVKDGGRWKILQDAVLAEKL